MQYDSSIAGGAVLDCGARRLNLDRPRVMGILNVTPDSFSDGGDFFSLENAVAHACTMAVEGAAIIDVGGESTRPGAAPVTVREEIARVVPVIAEIRRALPEIILSIDTSKPEVMRAAVAAGADMINDVYALRAEGALAAAAELAVPVCLMHMQGEPRTMQLAPHYEDVVAEVRDFLQERVKACEEAGITRKRLLIDPGFGFGKTVEHNLHLLGRLGEVRCGGLPILAGLSRKSMIGNVLGRPAGERLYASIALATLAAWQGAAIVRVHDVRATADALGICQAVLEQRQEEMTQR